MEIEVESGIYLIFDMYFFLEIFWLFHTLWNGDLLIMGLSVVLITWSFSSNRSHSGQSRIDCAWLVLSPPASPGRIPTKCCRLRWLPASPKWSPKVLELSELQEQLQTSSRRLHAMSPTRRPPPKRSHPRIRIPIPRRPVRWSRAPKRLRPPGWPSARRPLARLSRWRSWTCWKGSPFRGEEWTWKIHGLGGETWR